MPGIGGPHPSGHSERPVRHGAADTDSSQFRNTQTAKYTYQTQAYRQPCFKTIPSLGDFSILFPARLNESILPAWVMVEFFYDSATA
jgi:hypothetical protein